MIHSRFKASIRFTSHFHKNWHLLQGYRVIRDQQSVAKWYKEINAATVYYTVNICTTSLDKQATLHFYLKSLPWRHDQDIPLFLWGQCSASCANINVASRQAILISSGPALVCTVTASRVIGSMRDSENASIIVSRCPGCTVKVFWHLCGSERPGDWGEVSRHWKGLRKKKQLFAELPPITAPKESSSLTHLLSCFDEQTSRVKHPYLQHKYTINASGKPLLRLQFTQITKKTFSRVTLAVQITCVLFGHVLLCSNSSMLKRLLTKRFVVFRFSSICLYKVDCFVTSKTKQFDSYHNRQGRKYAVI